MVYFQSAVTVWYNPTSNNHEEGAMSFLNVVVAVFIASGFAGWGIIGKYSQVNGGWIGTMAMAITTITVALTSLSQLQQEIPNRRAMLLLIIAGILNGVAVCVYTSKITNPAIPASLFMALVFMFMIAVVPCLEWALNGTMPSSNHIIGYALAVGAIYFLSR